MILKSKKDQEIFFNVILNPRKPSSKLLEAVKQYKDLINKNIKNDNDEKDIVNKSRKNNYDQEDNR